MARRRHQPISVARLRAIAAEAATYAEGLQEPTRVIRQLQYESPLSWMREVRIGSWLYQARLAVGDELFIQWLEKMGIEPRQASTSMRAAWQLMPDAMKRKINGDER